MTIAVVIPFRDRGRDPLRKANLDTVMRYWDHQGYLPVAFDDGRSGDEQFNRSAAYNRAVAAFPTATMFIFTESDMLISSLLIQLAVLKAWDHPGLVIPFTEYRGLSELDSERVRAGAAPANFTPEVSFTDGKSIGAINVVSRKTLDLIGQWDETFQGSWYDDDAMKVAFEMCTTPTRFVTGPAYHLYHLPGWTGKHLTAEDRKATRYNRIRLGKYRLADSPGRIRELTKGGQ